MLKYYKTISAALTKAEHVSLIAPEKAYKKKVYSLLDQSLWEVLEPELKKLSPGLKGKKLKTYTAHKKVRTASFVCLPDGVSRNNSPTRKEWIFQQSAEIENHDNSAIILVLDDEAHYPAAAAAIARRAKLYSKKTANPKKKNFHIVACNLKGEVFNPTPEVKTTADGVAWTAKIVDTAPAEMNPKSFSAEIKSLFRGNQTVKTKEIVGDKLLTGKLHGVHAVGKCATEAPRLLLLDYHPRGAKKTIALVGKGVTYDSGGLSLKISGSMVGMKSDLGGAAAVVGAFKALVESKEKFRILAVLGIVENAIGPESFRNDDIITMHSGKTVEINNTDAEGRIVLADCVSYVGRNYQPDMIIDAATLTGAQMIATGLLHAGVVTNQDHVEELAKAAGKSSGDMVSPLPFAPEIFKAEFKSQVADMRNSVKNRLNAQSSCAAQFIYNHIEDLDIPWLHIDLAGPSTASGLGTGFGVGLMCEIARKA